LLIPPETKDLKKTKNHPGSRCPQLLPPTSSSTPSCTTEHQVHLNLSQVHLTSHKLSHSKFNLHICSSRQFISQIHNFICKINSHKIYSKVETHKISQPIEVSSISQKKYCVAVATRQRPRTSGTPRPLPGAPPVAATPRRAFRRPGWAPPLRPAGCSSPRQPPRRPRRPIGGPCRTARRCPPRASKVACAPPRRRPPRCLAPASAAACALLHLRKGARKS
jgi:hypothetical protein